MGGHDDAAGDAHGDDAGAHGADAVRGLAVADDGLRLVVPRTDLPRGRRTTLRFAITDDHGAVVRDLDVTHEKRMHLIVVRRDLSRLPAPPPRPGRGRHLVGRAHAAGGRLLPDARRLRPRRRGATRSAPTCASTAPRGSPRSRRRPPTRGPTATTSRLTARRRRPAVRDHARRRARPHAAVPRRRRPPRGAARGRPRLPPRPPGRRRRRVRDGVPERGPLPAVPAVPPRRAASTPPRSRARCPDEPRRAADHRHDVRLVREPDRAHGSTGSTGCPRRSTTRRSARPSTSTPAAVAADDLVAAVAAAGYSATLPEAAPEPEADPLTTRLVLSALLTLPVLLIAMIPPLQFDNWQWLSLTLAAPVVVWGAWPFHRAAWQNLRHGTATMDTLISVGVLAAFGWSLYALFLGDAGEPGLRMAFDLIPDGAGGTHEIYLEVASAVTVFMLAGRWFEARAKRRAGAALTALLELGARDVALLGDDGSERRVPVEQLAVGDRFVVRPGEKVATDGVVEAGHVRRRRVAADRRVRAGREAARRRGRGRDRQRGRAARRARDARRGRHRARPDRAARDRGAVRQGARAAARRPRVRRVRAGRARARRRHARLLARRRRGRDVRDLRRGRGADRRLPVRARARDPDRAARRHRPRRPARAADQGPRGARVHAPRRHDRARQDRHGDHGPDAARGGRPRRGRGRGRGPALRGRARGRRPSTRSRARSRRPPRRRCRRSRASPRTPGSASRAWSAAARC